MFISSSIVAELEKVGSTSTAEPNFFQIFRHICPVFRQNFTKSYLIWSNLNKFYESIQKLTKFTKFSQIITQFYLI